MVLLIHSQLEQVEVQEFHLADKFSLTSSNGGNNLIHIDTNGTVTTGTSANQKIKDG